MAAPGALAAAGPLAGAVVAVAAAAPAAAGGGAGAAAVVPHPAEAPAGPDRRSVVGKATKTWHNCHPPIMKAPNTSANCHSH